MKFLRMLPVRCIKLPAFLLLLLVVAASFPAVTRAQATPTLQVTPAYEGNYLPDRWLPLSIVLRNDGPPVRVLLAATLPNAEYRNTQSLELPGGGEVQATLLVAMNRDAREVQVTVEQDGTVLAEQVVAVRPRPGERMLGLVAPSPLSLSLPLREDLRSQPFVALNLTPADLPTHPAGLSSLSLLVLNNVATEQLRPDQLDALIAWVRSGGHLFLGGGPGTAALLAGLPLELHAAEPGATIQLETEPIAAYVEASPPNTLEGVTLTPTPGATVFGDPAAPLWVSRVVGVGQVTQLAFDPGLTALVDWPAAATFWERLLRSPALYPTPAGASYSPNQIGEQILSSALANLPPVNLPQSGLLFILLAIYTILIGPGMALLLRRLDRQSSGWAALPAVALGMLLIGSGIAFTQRADQRLTSEVMLVEQVDRDTARVRATLGILSPQDATFGVDVPPSVVTRPIESVSGQYGAVSPAGGDFSQDSGMLSLDVERWRIQGVLLDGMVELPALDATIQMGEMQIEAVVRNTVGVPLRDVTVVYAEQVARLGDIAVGAEARAPWPAPLAAGESRPNADTPLSLLVLADALAEGREAGGQMDRRVQLQEALINAAVGRGGAPADPGPLVFAWLDDDPIDLTINASGASAQQTILLVGRPLIVGGGSTFVPAGWLRLQPAEDDRQFCRSNLGLGLLSAPAPVIFDFALPADMATFTASELTLDLQSERTWPNAGVRVAIYNWTAGNWDEIRNFDGPGVLFIRQGADEYLGDGRLRVRLDGRIDEARCVFIDARLSGTLP